jgi:L-malate glycosyltransferase
MKRVLLIVNYKKSKGGIKVQVDIMKKKLDNDTLVRSEIFNTRGNIIQRLFFPFSLLLKAHRFDLFHIHGCSFWGGFYPIIIGVTLGKFLNKKTIITYHGGAAGDFLSKNRKTVIFFFKLAEIITVPSGYLQEIFQKYRIATQIVPNIIEFNEEKYITKNEIKPIFISIRSLEPVYNVQCIIEAFEKISYSYPESKLTIVGDGSLRAELESSVKEKKISGVTFTGAVSNEEVNSLLKNHDIFLSTSFIDNMPLSILEAFNAGLLVISSNVGGIPYLVNDNINGLLFESNDPVALAAKIDFALKNKNYIIELIKRAKTDVKKYTWIEIRNQIYSIYS